MIVPREELKQLMKNKFMAAGLHEDHAEDMAEVLNVAVGTLKATYHNAVKKIEESMRIVDTLPSFE